MSSATLNPIVISGIDLWNPRHTITNQELVSAYNLWAKRYNQQYTQSIAPIDLDPKPLSSVEFIDNASSIKQRYACIKK